MSAETRQMNALGGRADWALVQAGKAGLSGHEAAAALGVPVDQAAAALQALLLTGYATARDSTARGRSVRRWYTATRAVTP